MKNLISALTVTAGLTLGLLGGAQAQTITGTDIGGNTVYTADLNQTQYPPVNADYKYIVTLDSISPGVDVNSFEFNFGNEPLTYISSPGYTPLNPGGTNGVFYFVAPTGLTTVGQQATFEFYSPDPPTGTVSTASTSGGGLKAGGGVATIGPGPAVPEPASLALLGLGALPLALMARRRMAAK